MSFYNVSSELHMYAMSCAHTHTYTHKQNVIDFKCIHPLKAMCSHFITLPTTLYCIIPSIYLPDCYRHLGLFHL